MGAASAEVALEDIEICLLVDGIHARYGLDFRDYAHASLRRRIMSRLEPEGVRSVSGLLEKVLHEPAVMERLLLAITIHVTSMFRDPAFYAAFRSQVVPVLRTYPHVRIWHAGCSSGEEVYSMAILLKEEGVYDRCRIYATDLSEGILDRARSAVFPLGEMKEYTQNYIKAGGTAQFSDYYTADHERVVFRPALRKNVVFAPHNLVTDGSFNEFNVILCRNVMIYFNDALQGRVHKLFHESLGTLGFLALGSQESMRFSTCEDRYEPVDSAHRIYRKVS
jgi:chemotaxis protein methyltransferase CheR